MQAHPERRERELSFTLEEMALFAAASGDQSPLHMDEEFARRTAFGQRIIHGGLETIAMLGLLPSGALARVRSVRSTYPGPVLPGERCVARAQCRPGREDEWDIRLTARGKLLARVATSASADELRAVDPAGAISGEYHPSAAELDELVARYGIGALDPALRTGICWASNVVGMTLPDFDGLCAAVTLTSAGPDARFQTVRIREHDERTDRMLVDGALTGPTGEPALSGLIECFPFSPTPLPDSAALSGGPDSPERGTVVIVGASRGLGAALALAFLARGYRVHGVYARAQKAAAELVRLAGPYAERLHLHQLDAADATAVAGLPARIGGRIDGFALCAGTPAIPTALGGNLGDYVGRQLALATTPLTALTPLLDSERGWVLFCSTAELDRPPREQPQLAAAKSALEGLARWLAATSPATRVAIARLPRMRTDLANTPAARAAAAPPEGIAAMLVDRLTDEPPAPGFTVLEPDPQPVVLG